MTRFNFSYLKFCATALTLMAFALQGCTYSKYLSKHTWRKLANQNNPSIHALRHDIDTNNVYVYGQTPKSINLEPETLVSVLAFSDAYQTGELVDAAYNLQPGSHFAVALPPGDYQLFVAADSNNNQLLEPTEGITNTRIVLSEANSENQVHAIGNFPESKTKGEIVSELPTEVQLPARSSKRNSLYYPTGTIRTLDDPLFDDKMSIIGLYDPATFLDKSSSVFYALEDHLNHKIPVVFVHGIQGSARNFEDIIENLDSKKYQFLFFHYPSGGDLDQLAELFYDIFISGNVVPTSDMPMAIVAHSMGGLVVREALNHLSGANTENNISLFISLASPFGGHEQAAVGEKRAPYVLPAWRDLNPNNGFIKTLFKNPLPKDLEHHLLYAFDDSSRIRFGANSDGVVTLASQLYAPAQQQAKTQLGINTTHTGILVNSEAKQYIVNELAKLTNIYPPEQLAWFDKGGFDTKQYEHFNEHARYNIQHYGHFILALSQNKVAAVTRNQKEFLKALRGEKTELTEMERDIIAFVRDRSD